MNTIWLLFLFFISAFSSGVFFDIEMYSYRRLFQIPWLMEILSLFLARVSLKADLDTCCMNWVLDGSALIQAQK